jgi:hypothetical protein
MPLQPVKIKFQFPSLLKMVAKAEGRRGLGKGAKKSATIGCTFKI